MLNGYQLFNSQQCLSPCRPLRVIFVFSIRKTKRPLWETLLRSKKRNICFITRRACLSGRQGFAETFFIIGDFSCENPAGRKGAWTKVQSWTLVTGYPLQSFLFKGNKKVFPLLSLLCGAAKHFWTLIKASVIVLTDKRKLILISFKNYHSYSA